MHVDSLLTSLHKTCHTIRVVLSPKDQSANGGDDRYTVPKQAQGIGTKHIAKAQVEMQQGGTNRPEIVMANPDSDRPSKRTVHRRRLV
jgi:predicted helicase